MTRHSLTVTFVFGVVVLMFLRLPPMVAKHDSVFNTYHALIEVDAIAKQRYVEPIDDDRLVIGAMRGMLRQLDPYSSYLSAKQLAALEQRIGGEYIGIGAEIGIRERHSMIIAPLEGSPAARMGVRAGDLILAIDGRDVKGLSIAEIEDALRGEVGSSVTLTLRHRDDRSSTRIEIVRDHILLETVRGFTRCTDGSWDYMIDPERRIAYLRVSNFHETTMRGFNDALADILDRKASGLILDLRFNPGGILTEAVRLVDRFLSEGVIVSTVTRRGVEHDYFASTSNTAEELDLVVLINGGSASAAEIVAGSLQDHHRATIVGERSFGKGSVQRVLRLTTHKAGIKLTMAYYRLPSGRIIHRKVTAVQDDDWGIFPDIEVVLSHKEWEVVQQSRLTTRLANPATETTQPNTHSSISRSSTGIDRDRQLVVAIDLLRSKQQGEETSHASHN